MVSKVKKTKKKKQIISFKRQSAWEDLKPGELKTIMAFAETYKTFLGTVKTERECVDYSVKQLKKRGYKPLESFKRLKKGDKVFKTIKNRAFLTAIIGQGSKPWRFVGAHIDSPRLDLKPNPLYEDVDLAMMKTHYYGGIKKYQWVNVPLSMHAVVHTKDGRQRFTLGEFSDEPQFIIPDMAPHLARQQMNKSGREIVGGEQLRIIMGNRPLEDCDEADKIKMFVLDWLHEKHGIVERDLLSADISFVPAAKAVDIGLDRSMIAAYGQDDRICAFALLEALKKLESAKGVAVGLFVDKEEIGSSGDTGAQSRMLDYFVTEVKEKMGLSLSIGEIMENATAISADVTEAINPNFKEVSDDKNTSFLGGGISVEKYGGGGGKYDTNDASSEYMNWLTRLLDKGKIHWQTGELGKLDLGGGGTIAMFLSRYGMDAIDAGPPLLSMHSTQEVCSKVDLYQAYKCYQAFLVA